MEETFNGEVRIASIDDKVGEGALSFANGKLEKFEGAGIESIMKLVGDDPTGRIIGEFGIGTNRGARICKDMLEAEKAFGTCHFAVGDSYGLGTNASVHHYDMLVEKVTIEADGRTLIREGQFEI